MPFFNAWPIRSHCQIILVLLNHLCFSTNVHIVHYFLFHTLHWNDLPVVIVVIVVDVNVDDIVRCCY
jgi:hypothetical protein